MQDFRIPSKINLGLEVLHKRNDGYHELNTLFFKIEEPHDVLQVSETSSFQFTVSDKNIPADESNLVYKAAILFAEHTHVALPNVHIHLIKNIPHGAGLGGGSSDAAAMLKFLNQDNLLSSSELHTLATKLGADVPFFLLEENAAIGSGIGEKLAPITISLHRWIVIVKPRSIAIPTKEAYARLILHPNRTATDLASLDWSQPATLREKVTNDFEFPAFAMFPELRELKQQLYNDGAELALMSGSGSAFFALFATEQTARESMQSFDRKAYVVALHKTK